MCVPWRKSKYYRRRFQNRTPGGIDKSNDQVWVCEKKKTPGEENHVSLAVYYKNVNCGTTDTARIRLTLHNTIKGHLSYSYRCVWSIVNEADEDPDNLENVLTVYNRDSRPKRKKNSLTLEFNREHVWSKSQGFPKQWYHGYTDAHHIRAADPRTNAQRSNHNFGDVLQASSVCPICHFDGTFFTPPLESRGDIARMMFYMDIRYDGEEEYDILPMPDLELLTNKSVTSGPYFGNLCLLLQWHLDDPVDTFERRRNDVIHAWQGNRNPFIDEPELVQRLYGERCPDVVQVSIKACSWQHTMSSIFVLFICLIMGIAAIITIAICKRNPPPRDLVNSRTS